MKTAVLTDIEGTTSSVSFVKEVLFPYARRALPSFVARTQHEPEVRHWLDDVAARTGAERDAAVVETLQTWIDEDRKDTALKALQGMIWREGYERAAYRAHIYPDAERALRRWRKAGHALYVYSSGSAEAQRLFFRHSAAGDLEQLFDGFFDTQVGPKHDAASYRRIARAIGRDPASILFLSDAIQELDAAAAAGMRTGLVARPEESTAAASSDHPAVSSFDQIAL